MRQKHATTGESDLFRARLDQIINMKHELVQLAGKLDWDWLDNQMRRSSVIRADPPQQPAS